MFQIELFGMVGKKFITGSPMTLPKLNFDGTVYPGSIADLMGLPIKLDAEPTESIQINDLPFRAFYKIYQDYYIDQNLHKTGNFLTIDTTYEDFLARYPNAFTELNRFRRSWEKDYFTSALPWAQKVKNFI